MKNLAIIPARGGSKRIPRKNIKDFLGKPIIAYSIETALKSNLFDEIMVSTDDNEIADVALKYGAKVPFLRSKENADDFATLADVIDEVKKFYVSNNIVFDNICCILPTAPLILMKNFIKAYNLLISTPQIDSVRPVVRFSYPIQRALKLSNGKLDWMYPEFKYSRSQDLEPAFHDAGQFYWMKFSATLRGEKKYAIEISELYAQDIDNVDDWKFAEMKYSMIFNVK